ncbi:hypothetical protein CRG98_019433, partial [Punica granatum]
MATCSASPPSNTEPTRLLLHIIHCLSFECLISHTPSLFTMEIEQHPNFRQSSAPSSPSKISSNNGKEAGGQTGLSFMAPETGVPPATVCADEKLSWLRSQIIGADAEFMSPFGRRRITYADHTASGRCLQYIENFIANNVLPFY